MRSKFFSFFIALLCICIVSINYSCEKKKEYAKCIAICDNFDTVSQYISARINGKLYQSDDAALYKINGNELMNNCLFNIMGETGADSTLSVFFIGDTSITIHETLDNVKYFNLGVVSYRNNDNHNLKKYYSSSVFSKGTGIKNGEIQITSISDCRMNGSFNFIGIDERSSDTIQVTDGEFSVRLY